MTWAVARAAAGCGPERGGAIEVLPPIPDIWAPTGAMPGLAAETDRAGAPAGLGASTLCVQL